MLRIYDNKTIVIHRGDSGVIKVEIKDENGSKYTMQSGDRLKFTVRENANHTDTILIEAITADDMIVLTPDVTDIPAGKYSCDLQLNKANGDVVTIFPELNRKGLEYNFRNFVVDAEVSDR